MNAYAPVNLLYHPYSVHPEFIFEFIYHYLSMSPAYFNALVMFVSPQRLRRMYPPTIDPPVQK